MSQAGAETAGLTLVVAMGRNRAIGYRNRMPWHLPSDLSRFKRLTLGKAVIMGRRTFQSIGRPLPQRLNIVLTRDPDFQVEGVLRADGLDTAQALIRAAGLTDEAMVIGGAQVYALALPHATRIELTEVEASPEGDAFFPALDAREWREVSRERHAGDPAFSFVRLERVPRGQAVSSIHEM